jgi:hypothetical protein
LKKKNKIDRLLANMIKMRREKTQINKIRNPKREDHNNHQENPGNLQRLL